MRQIGTSGDWRSRRSAGSRGLDARSLALAGMMAALTAVLAYIRIPLPFSPVPVSAQTLAVMFAGALLGARLGAFSQLVYVLMGAVGLPVFAGGQGGPAVLAGPTGGYLIGFILGAYVVGRMTEQARERLGTARLLFAFAVGGVGAVYVPGVLQLALVTGMTLPQAIAAGVLPFLVGDGVKVLAAAIVVVNAQAALRAPRHAKQD